VGDGRHLAGDLVAQDLVRRDAAAVETLETVPLGWRETEHVAVQLRNGWLPPRAGSLRLGPTYYVRRTGHALQQETKRRGGRVPLWQTVPMDEPGARSDRWIGRTVVFLLAAEVVILVLDVIFNYLAVIDDDGIQELFNVARELSVGNWFSSLQTAGVGLVLWLIYLKTREELGGKGKARGWAVLALLFFYIGMDDGTRMHERVSTAVANYFAITAESHAIHTGPAGWIGTLLDHFPSYAWQVLFGPAFAAFGLFMVVFLWRRLERKRALLVFFGLFLYGIAQGQDFIEGLETPYEWLTARLGTEPYTVPHLAKMGEEYLEMLGTTVALYVFLEKRGQVTK